MKQVTTLRGNRRQRRGGSAIEFAFILPVLLSLVLGMIDFGYYFVQEGYVVSAAREAARLGVTYDSTDAEAEAEARGNAVLAEHGLSGTVNAQLSGTSPEEVLSVTVDVDYDPLVGFIHFPAGFQMHGSMTMLLELQD